MVLQGTLKITMVHKWSNNPGKYHYRARLLMLVIVLYFYNWHFRSI